MKKYSAVKATVLSLILLFSLGTVCCKSTEMAIPGEEQYRIENITAEYYQIAKAYYDLKNYNKAIEYYKLAMRDKKLEQSAYYQTGICYVMQKDWPNAEKVFNNLLEKDPQNAALKSSVAYIKANSGKFEESLVLYGELNESYPNDSNYLINYITILIANKSYEMAEQKLNDLKERFPDESQITVFETKIADGLEPKKDTEETENPEETELSEINGLTVD